jgi:hypothetical protein
MFALRPHFERQGGVDEPLTREIRAETKPAKCREMRLEFSDAEGDSPANVRPWTNAPGPALSLAAPADLTDVSGAGDSGDLSRCHESFALEPGALQASRSWPGRHTNHIREEDDQRCLNAFFGAALSV